MENDIIIVTDHIEIHPGAGPDWAVVRDGSTYGTYETIEIARGVAGGLAEDE